MKTIFDSRNVDILVFPLLSWWCSISSQCCTIDWDFLPSQWYWFGNWCFPNLAVGLMRQSLYNIQNSFLPQIVFTFKCSECWDVTMASFAIGNIYPSHTCDNNDSYFITVVWLTIISRFHWLKDKSYFNDVKMWINMFLTLDKIQHLEKTFDCWQSYRMETWGL